MRQNDLQWAQDISIWAFESSAYIIVLGWKVDLEPPFIYNFVLYLYLPTTITDIIPAL